MDIEELQKQKSQRFNVLVVKKWRLEHELEATNEELAKLQGGYEALNEAKECVNDDSR